MNEKEKTNSSVIFLAIVIAGGLVAGAVFLNKKSVNSNLNEKEQITQTEKSSTSSIDNLTPVTKEDHIMGNPNALIKIVEYSDFECPFCKKFHQTMNQIMDKYGKSGKVAWVFRHYPIEQLHPIKARKEAVASECVAELGGSEKFWKFTNRFFELTPSNNRTDLKEVIPQIISELGIDKNTFNGCWESNKYDQHIQNEIDNAILTGGRGTPWSIIIIPGGENLPLSGAQSFKTVQSLIDFTLNNQ